MTNTWDIVEQIEAIFKNTKLSLFQRYQAAIELAEKTPEDQALFVFFATGLYKGLANKKFSTHTKLKIPKITPKENP